jgi:DNA-binding PadR family transcriptional regulator
MLDPSVPILASVAQSEKHGYAIMVDIQHFANRRLSSGTLYAAIARLRDRRFIRPVLPADRRHMYRITAFGKRHLEQQLEQLDLVVGTARRRLEAD